MSIQKRLFTFLCAPAFLSPLFASKKDTVGGQALIEGVMMRSKERIAWAVRKPDGGAVIESYPFVSVTKRVKVWGIPVVRGVINLFESLSWGYKALSRSADIAIEEEEKAAKDKASGDNGAKIAVSADSNPSVSPKIASADGIDGQNSSTDNIAGPAPSADNPPASPTAKKKPSFMDQFYNTITLIIAFGISIALFMYAPMWTVNNVPFIQESPMLFNLTAGIIRIVLFLIYITLISLWSDMRRVFEYHGAEHKAIFAFEDGKDLTVDNIEPYTTVHPRCGTSFLILVALCSILLFSVIDALYIQYVYDFRDNLPYRFGLHLVLMPLVAGISYEFLKLSDRFQHWPIVGMLIKPGLWLQRITTRKPDAAQIGIAVKALEAAL